MKRFIMALVLAMAGGWQGVRGQVLDSPVTVPLFVEGKLYAADWESAWMSIEVLGATGTYAVATPWGPEAWHETSRGSFNLRPGKDYQVQVGLQYVGEFYMHLDTLPGYRVFLEDAEEPYYYDNAMYDENDWRMMKVRIEAVGEESRGHLGETGSLRPSRIVWHVSMGKLRSGRGAGAIELREETVSDAVNAGKLYYDTNSAEVEVIYSSGQLRQVWAADGLADIIDQTTYYEIKFYRNNQVGSLSGGVYLLSGSALNGTKLRGVFVDFIQIRFASKYIII